MLALHHTGHRHNYIDVPLFLIIVQVFVKLSHSLACMEESEWTNVLLDYTLIITEHFVAVRCPLPVFAAIKTRLHYYYSYY